MRNNILKILLHLTIILILISFFCFLVYRSSIFTWTITLITIICVIVFVKFREDLFAIMKGTPVDRYISLVSLEIALIVFIQTSIYEERNNKQFEENRIASEHLFKTQLSHTEKLNQLQIKNAKILNDSLVQELNKIQDINLNQNLAAKNQLIATQRQLELSRQSLIDYINETKSNLIFESIKITDKDTLNEKEIKLIIENKIKNVGRREAKDVEVRIMVIFKDKNISKMSVNKDASFLNINNPVIVNYYPIVPLKELENFYYWIQVRYYDEKLDQFFDRSYYRHYYKSSKGFDFYYASNKQKLRLREIVDKELKKNGYSLTKN